MPKVMQNVIVAPGAIQDRLERGRSTAGVITSRMLALGVDVRLFGSMKTDDVIIGSNIDILVIDCGPLDHEEIAF
jgi:predicted nucleotidyltransferase